MIKKSTNAASLFIFGLVIFTGLFGAQPAAANILEECEDFKSQSSRQECERQNRKLIMKIVLSLSISAGYMGLATGLREGPYKSHPTDNQFGSVNGVLGMTILGAGVGIGAGFLCGLVVLLATDDNYSARVIGGVMGIIFAISGAIAGGILGYQFRESFTEKRGLYYSAAGVTAFVPSLILIKFSL